MVFVLFVQVKDLNKFFEFLKSKGLDIDEGMHSVLLDSSELGIWYGLKNGKKVLIVISHYINSHYAVLAALPSNASDREILEALMKVDRSRLWRVPVEPTIIVSNSEALGRIILEYQDDYPIDSQDFYRHYIMHGTNRDVLRSIVSNVASIAKELE